MPRTKRISDKNIENKSKDDIVKVQQQLLDAGYDIGAPEPDGIWGKVSKRSYDAYVQDSIREKRKLSGVFRDFYHKRIGVPLNVNQLGYDIFGGEGAITEKSLRKNELDLLKDIARKNLAKGKNVIEYADYGTSTNPYSDVGGSSSNFEVVKKMLSPAYNLKTTLGQASIQVTPQDTIISDQYNYNNRVPNPNVVDYLRSVPSRGPSIYGQARNLGRFYGSPSGEGSKVDIRFQDGGQIPEGNDANKNRPFDPEMFMRGIKSVESANGQLMFNPSSTATGFYGQLYSTMDPNWLKENEVLNREQFGADTTLQNEYMRKSIYGDMSKTGRKTNLFKDAVDLEAEYKPQIGKSYKYRPDEIAALSHFLGRGGARGYLGNTIRDKKPYKVDEENKTPEEYLQLYNEAIGDQTLPTRASFNLKDGGYLQGDSTPMGQDQTIGEFPIYQGGGEIVPNPTSAPFRQAPIMYDSYGDVFREPELPSRYAALEQAEVDKQQRANQVKDFGTAGTALLKGRRATQAEIERGRSGIAGQAGLLAEGAAWGGIDMMTEGVASKLGSKAVSKIASRGVTKFPTPPKSVKPKGPFYELESMGKLKGDKSGLVARGNIESVIKGHNTPQSDKVLLQKILDDKYPNQKKINVSNLKQAVNDEIIGLRSNPSTEYSTYGTGRLGYDDTPPLTIAAETDVYSSPELGSGSDMHFDDPNALAHNRTWRFSDDPNTLYVPEAQSDYFQNPESPFRELKGQTVENLQKQIDRMESANKSVGKNIEGAAPIHDMNPGSNRIIKWILNDGDAISDNVYKELQIQARGQGPTFLSKKAEIKNLEQKKLLEKAMPKRLLQENLMKAAKEGRTAVRYPTRETGEVIQDFKRRTLDATDIDAYRRQAAELTDELNLSLSHNSDLDPTTRKSYQEKIDEAYEAIDHFNKHGSDEPFLGSSQQTISNRYAGFPSLAKKELGVEPKIVKDYKGNEWYEVAVPKSYAKGKPVLKPFAHGGVLGGAELYRQQLREFEQGGYLGDVPQYRVGGSLDALKYLDNPMPQGIFGQVAKGIGGSVGQLAGGIGGLMQQGPANIPVEQTQAGQQIQALGQQQVQPALNLGTQGAGTPVQLPPNEGGYAYGGDLMGLPEFGFGSWLGDNAGGILQGAGSAVSAIPGIGMIAGPILNMAGKVTDALVGKKRAAEAAEALKVKGRLDELRTAGEQQIAQADTPYYGAVAEFGGDLTTQSKGFPAPNQNPVIVDYSGMNTHDQGGVQVDAKGNPMAKIRNLSQSSAVGEVEGGEGSKGEVAWNGYIFSDKLKV